MRGLLLGAVAVFAAAAGEPGFRFETNLGQAESSVRYLARARGSTAIFEDSAIRVGGVTLRFAGENPGARWEAADPLPSTSSYFRGADPTRWVRHAPHFARLLRYGVYPGIDVVFYGNGDRLEFDFVLAPGADPASIRLAFEGASLRLSPAGDLMAETGSGRLTVHRPVIYQSKDAGKVEIAGAFRVDAAEARFEVGQYDSSRPLTIDPTLQFWSYVGGTSEDRITALSPVPWQYGDIVAGVTTSTGLSSSPGRGGKDIFVWNGESYTVYGGSGDEEPTAVTRGGNGWILVGWTSSRDFPLISSGSPQRVYGGGARDGFFIVSSYPGPYASYVGGSGDDAVLAVAADPNGRAIDVSGYYLAGETSSPDFPVRAAIQPTPGGGKDGFLTRLSAPGAILESTYWGGSGDDSVFTIEAAGNSCWLGGRTTSADLRLVNPRQAQLGGAADGFLARVDESAAPAVVYASYVGGRGDDELRALRSVQGWILAGGTTASPDLPVTAGSPPYAGGGADVWAGRFHAGTGLPSFLTYFGGSGHDELGGIALDGNGEMYLAGWTTSGDLRAVDALQSSPGYGEDGFLARIDRDGAPQMVTYVGGEGDDRLAAVAIGADQSVWAAGQTQSAAIGAFAGTTPRVAAAGQVDGLIFKMRPDGVYAPDVLIGRNLSVKLEVNVISGSQSMPATVRSLDPSLVQVNGGAFASAPATLTAASTDGDTELIVSAPGVPARRVRARVRPSYLVNPYMSEVVVPLDGSVSLKLTTAVIDPESGELLYQTGREYAEIGVTWRTDQPGVVQVRDASNTSSQSISATVRGVAEGVATITAEDPRLPVLGPREIRVRVARKIAPVLSLRDAAVGRLMQTPLQLRLTNTQVPITFPVDVRIISEDPSRLLLGTSPSAASSEAVVVPLSSYDGSPAVWARGRENGVARVRIEVEGAPPVYGNIAVVPGVFAMATPAQTINIGFGSVVRDLGVTSYTMDLWSTRTLFAIYGDIGNPPAGFAVNTQIPSPEARNSFNVVSSDPGVARGAPGLTFSLNTGAIYALFGLGLVAPGTTTLTVETPDFGPGPAIALTVRPGTLPLARAELTLGKDLQTQFALGTPYDFPRGIPFTITSSDPSKVAVGMNSYEELPKIVMQATPGGGYKVDHFYITALASSGDVALTVSAADYGFAPRTVVVHLAPTTFRLTPAAQTVTQTGSVSVNIQPWFPGPMVPYAAYTIRPSIRPTFQLTSSDPAVVKVNTPDPVMSGYYVNAQAVAVGMGVAELRLAGVSNATVDPEWSRSTVTVVSRKITFGTSTMALGKDLQVVLLQDPYPLNIEGARIRSLDPSRLLLTRDPAVAGVADIEARGYLWVQALADSGDAWLSIYAPGYEEARIRVLLYPTAIGFWEFGRPVRQTVAPDATVPLQVSPMAIDSASGNPILLSNASFRGGMDAFEARIKNSDPSVGRVFSTIAFSPGMQNATTQFRADAKGVATLSIEPPAGFVDGGALFRREIEVAAPRLTLSSITLGKDLQYYHQVSFSSPLTSTQAVTVTSSDPSKVLVSSDPKQLGQASATVTASPSTYSIFYVQALDSSGTVTLTATANGYDSAAATVRLEPSYFAFERDSSSRYPYRMAYNETVQRHVYFTHPSNQHPWNKVLRPGVGAQTVPIESSDPSIVTVNDPIVLPEGYEATFARVVAGAPGTATLRLGAPAGFSLGPDQDRSAAFEVRLREFEINGGYLAKDRVYAIGEFRPVEWASAVRLVSADPSSVLLSLDPKVPGTAEVAFTGDPKNSIRVYAHALADSGTATVRATAVGFADKLLTFTLQRSGFYFSQSTATVAAGRSVTVRVGTSDSQPIRPGASPVTLAIENSNAAVATASTVVFGPGDKEKELVITGKTPGIAVLTIRDAGGQTSINLAITVTAN